MYFLLAILEILATGKVGNNVLVGDNAMDTVGEDVTGLLESSEGG